VQTQIVIRKVQRHPITKKIARHVVRNTAMSIVPNTVNDVVFHHAQLNFDEFIHVTQDSLIVNILGTIHRLI
jgi:hypothetical protein